jgi:hypothetical protein
MWMKNMGCVGCHQMGDLATRTIPSALEVQLVAGCVDAAHSIRSGRRQHGQIAMGTLKGIPIKYLADWTDRIAAGELPANTPPRPSGMERNVVATVRDWSDAKSYLHDLSGTDRNHPTVNGYGPLYGSPELSTDEFPILDPQRNIARTFKAPVRDADTPSTHDDPVVAPSPYWGEERIWDSRAVAHNPMLDHQGASGTPRASRAEQSAFCKAGSQHPSAQLFPIERSGRQIAVYEPKNGKVHLRRHLLLDASPAIRRGRRTIRSGPAAARGHRLARHQEIRCHRRRGRRAALGALRARHQGQRASWTSGSSPASRRSPIAISAWR